MTLRTRLRRLEVKMKVPGRCRVCRDWPAPVLRLLAVDDPMAGEEPEYTACPACGWHYQGTHTILIEEQVVAPNPLADHLM